MTAATPPSPLALDTLKGFGLIIVGDEILSGKRIMRNNLSKIGSKYLKTGFKLF